jgi:hypothetical protein
VIFDVVDCVPTYSTMALLEMKDISPFYGDPTTATLLCAVASISTLQEWVRLGLRQQTYPTGQPVADALAMTLVCDGVTGEEAGWRQPKLFLAHFRDWLNILLANEPQTGIGVRKLRDQMESWPATPTGRKIFEEVLGLDLDPETAAEEAIIMFAMNCSIASVFHNMAVMYSCQRTFLTTQRGLFGLAPRGARQGDSIALLSGLKYPFVLRRNGERWHMLGPAYIHGVMDGEAWPQGQGPLTSFLIA